MQIYLLIEKSEKSLESNLYLSIDIDLLFLFRVTNFIFFKKKNMKKIESIRFSPKVFTMPHCGTKHARDVSNKNSRGCAKCLNKTQNIEIRFGFPKLQLKKYKLEKIIGGTIVDNKVNGFERFYKYLVRENIENRPKNVFLGSKFYNFDLAPKKQIGRWVSIPYTKFFERKKIY